MSVQHLREARWRKQTAAEEKRRKNVLGRAAAALRAEWDEESRFREEARLQDEIAAFLASKKVTVLPSSPPWMI